MKTTYIFEFQYFITLFVLCTAIAGLLLGINFFIAKTKKTRIKDAEKLSAYECGFDPFEEARLQFNVHYYIVGLLFLIFDIEIVYLFPAVGILQNFTINEIMNIFFFLTILTVGFLYEWAAGVLKW